jgi:hypothetical protein
MEVLKSKTVSEMLSMNRTSSSHPSPPVGEKVPGGRMRGICNGSWHRFASAFGRCFLPMDRRADILSASSRGILPREARGKDASLTGRLEAHPTQQRALRAESAKCVRNYLSLDSPGTACPTGETRRRALRSWTAWLVLFWVCFAKTLPASAQVSKEYQVKAVCLWRLAQFVTWPANAFENANSPVVIAVLGENPFGDLLNAAVSGETAHDRRLVVQHHRSVSDIKSCHILFVSASEAGQVNKVVAETAGRSILTVADFEDFARTKGGMVCFRTRENKVKLQINLKAVTAARLGLDPRLLRSAEIIDNE